MNRDFEAQLIDGAASDIFLRESQYGAAKDYGQNDTRVYPLPGKNGNDRGNGQNKDKGIFELADEKSQCP